uniref:Uncharacterized protein n=1 Tax=Arundo donax TaxID=35708 RepID=A0A0A8Z756_ARUDO
MIYAGSNMAIFLVSGEHVYYQTMYSNFGLLNF